jgi:hypothetical protein
MRIESIFFFFWKGETVFACRWLIGLTLLSAVGLALGCGGGGPKEYPVTGTVTFDGQPVEQGEIIFFPSDMGKPYASAIVSGKFECRVPVGEHRVEITATRESPTPASDGLPNYESYIPAEYNTESTLTASVADGGDNTFTFELQAPPARRR